MNLLLVDDHDVVRQGLKAIIQELYPGAVTAETGTFDKALDFLKETVFDLVILDVNLPGGNSVDMLDALRLRQAEVKILVFSSFSEELYALRFLQRGANGYLNKLHDTDEIRKAITAVIEGKIYASPAVKDEIYNRSVRKKEYWNSPWELISDRELEVANLLLKGASTLEITKILNIKASTVSTYKQRLMEKLGASNIVELIDKLRLYRDARL